MSEPRPEVAPLAIGALFVAAVAISLGGVAVTGYRAWIELATGGHWMPPLSFAVLFALMGFGWAGIGWSLVAELSEQGVDAMSHDHSAPCDGVALLAIGAPPKSAPDAEGYWWARHRADTGHDQGAGHDELACCWTLVQVTRDQLRRRRAWTLGCEEPGRFSEFDAWIGPLEPPTVTP